MRQGIWSSYIPQRGHREGTKEGTAERTPSGNGKAPLISFITIYSIYKQHLSLTGSKIFSLFLPGKVCWVLISWIFVLKKKYYLLETVLSTKLTRPETIIFGEFLDSRSKNVVQNKLICSGLLYYSLVQKTISH